MVTTGNLGEEEGTGKAAKGRHRIISNLCSEVSEGEPLQNNVGSSETTQANEGGGVKRQGSVDKEDPQKQKENALPESDDSSDISSITPSSSTNPENNSEEIREGSQIKSEKKGKGCPLRIPNICSPMNIGFALALIVLFLDHSKWILHEMYTKGEGHYVSKLNVILFFMFVYSFIFWSFEVIRGGCYFFELFYPRGFFVLEDWTHDKLEQNPRFGMLRYLKALGAPFFTLIACNTWRYSWRFYVCKSLNDRSCRATWIGRTLSQYRNEACYDDSGSSVLCERFISFSPLLLLTLITIIAGNVVLPVLNDYLMSFVFRVRDKTRDLLYRMQEERLGQLSQNERLDEAGDRKHVGVTDPNKAILVDGVAPDAAGDAN